MPLPPEKLLAPEDEELARKKASLAELEAQREGVIEPGREPLQAGHGEQAPQKMSGREVIHGLR